MKNILAFLVLLCPTACLAQSVTNDCDKVYEVAEEMPQYPGGFEAMNKFIYGKMKNPSKSPAKGRTVIDFVVKADGSLSDFVIKMSSDSLLGNEALRVVKSMPKWTPGKMKGKPVCVKSNVVVNFMNVANDNTESTATYRPGPEEKRIIQKISATKWNNFSLKYGVSKDTAEYIMTLAEQLVRINPKQFTNYLELAHDYSSLGRFDDALQTIDTMEKECCRDYFTMTLRGHVFDCKGDTLEANKAYEKALEMIENISREAEYWIMTQVNKADIIGLLKGNDARKKLVDEWLASETLTEKDKETLKMNFDMMPLIDRECLAREQACGMYVNMTGKRTHEEKANAALFRFWRKFKKE